MKKSHAAAKWRGWGLFGALALAGALYWAFSGPKERAPGALRKAPEFALKTENGAAYTLRSFEGKAVLVHFWAAWCPPCLEEIKQFVESSQGQDPAKIAYVTISLDPKWEEVSKILPSSRLPANVISLLDPTGMISEDYGTYQFPETYLLNAKHEIVHKWVGGQDWKNPVFAAGLLKVIQR